MEGFTDLMDYFPIAGAKGGFDPSAHQSNPAD
jgi:hypothetical protein